MSALDTGLYYTNYLQAGGRLVLLGENYDFPTRNTCIINFVTGLGGGTIGEISDVTYGPQTVQSPFTGPNALSTTIWQGAGLTTSPGAGSFISSQVGGGFPTPIVGTGGTPILFAPGTLSVATAGTLIVIFDVNFLDPVSAGETTLAENIIANLSGGPAAALIIYRLSDGYSHLLAVNLQALMVAAGYAVTLTEVVSADLSGYGQVWDVRYGGDCPFQPPPASFCSTLTCTEIVACTIDFPLE